MTIDLEQVRAAAEAIRGSVVRTECPHSRTLSEIAGCRVHLKLESHQFTGAFKDRGALNRMLALTPEERARGVIAMSAGNHAQAVAHHARRLDIAATIVMPRNTPNLKVRNTQASGAEVHLEGAGVDEAGAYARRLADERDLVFIHPYDDERIIAGQGTIGLELLEDLPDVDTVVVPVGGGGLLGGIAVAMRALAPGVELIGVQSDRFPAMRDAIAGRTGTYGPATIADGIAVKKPGMLTTPLIRDLVDEIRLVSEADIERAILLLLEIEKTVAEGAGAAGLAAVLADPGRFRGRRVAVVICGGNIDLLALSWVIERGLVRTGRVVRVRVGIPDVPGSLAELTRLLADEGANVIQIAHQRAFTPLPSRAVEVEAVLETLGREHTQRVLERLRSQGYDPLVPESEPHPNERENRP